MTKVNKRTGEVLGPVVRKPYSRTRIYTPIEGESMTHESHAESCDINNIIRQFDRTGVLPPPTRQPYYGDVTALQVDMTEAVAASQEIMEEASANLRKPKKKESVPQDDEPVNPDPDPASKDAE